MEDKSKKETRKDIKIKKVKIQKEVCKFTQKNRKKEN